MSNPFETNADAALVELFRAESDTHIPVLSQGLLSMEKGQADEQSIASMMRAAHSIKGAARIVGIEAAVRVSHIMEDCFTSAKVDSSILSSDSVDVLLQGVDALQRICALQPEADMTEAWLASILEQLTSVKDGRASKSSTRQPMAPPPFASAVPVAPSPPSVSEVTIVTPADFDDTAAEDLRHRLAEALVAKTSRITIDFTPTRHISAGALALLASLARDAGHMDDGPSLNATGVSSQLAALLKVSGLDRVICAAN